MKIKVIDYALRLFLVCAVASGILAYVYESTASRVKLNAERQKILKAKNLLPAEAVDIKEVSAGGVVFFEGLSRSGQRDGVIIESGFKGYGGLINLLVGVGNDGKIIGVVVISHSETPGLGAKVGDAQFLSQFKGKGKGAVALKKDAGNSQDGIDAVAAATISSRAVVNAVQQALEKYEEVKDAR